MKGKNVARILIFTLFILFTILYITQAFGYFNITSRKTNALTEEGIKQFEEDLKMGKNIKASDYVKKENDYNNKISKSGMAISNLIEKTFNGVMGLIFNEVQKAVND